ncbi:hypothetical protein AB5J52_48375 (plasmid) [Streptomyces sp. R39]|uniref:ANTAR domain-containing protein n=1 Tax=Streptomyces sp. R39 TaxID=3238631 RepID=A0AB39R502_9ACTN
MTTLEEGLHVRDGYAAGPLAESAERRAARAGMLLGDIQARATAWSDAELFDQVHHALRHFTQRTPHAGQVRTLADQIRRGTVVAWDYTGRLPCA